jgi:hypothetical protein
MLDRAVELSGMMAPVVHVSQPMEEERMGMAVE